MGRAKVLLLLQRRRSSYAYGFKVVEPVPESSQPEFLNWLREATVWQRIGRLVPLSWIVILVWPLTLLLTRGVGRIELAVSLFGLATFALVWTWFWLQPGTGTDPTISTGVLIGMTAIATALTLGNPRIWHDGLLGYCMVVAAVWPSWRPSAVAVPAVVVLVFLAVTATGSGTINALGVALVWLFLGFGFVAVQHLLRANLRLHEARVLLDRKPSPSHIVTMSVSPRQREIMSLVAAGMSDKEIASRLHVSPYTVRTHLQRLYASHGLHNRAEAAATWMIGRQSPSEDREPV